MCGINNILFCHFIAKALIIQEREKKGVQTNFQGSTLGVQVRYMKIVFNISTHGVGSANEH